ncbi:MAG TPA: hypothetical protein PKZ89_00975, partial [Alphaproteobacteria bacterium]|nr:hypothetical protein [Alphaproteobacteria bacterium]
HVPSRAFLVKPYPSNLPQIEVCQACNESFSKDEEYFSAFLSCVLSGSTSPEGQSNNRAKRILERSPKLRARIENSKRINKLGNDIQIVWQPEEERISNIVIKNARGHAYYEFGEPMLNPPVCVPR